MDEEKDFNFEELEKMFMSGEGIDEDMLRGMAEEEEIDQEWRPRFPVDMENPVELTEEQQERALRIFDSLSAHMDAYPEDTYPPLICITQDWRVRVDFGGWNCASDYRDDALCVMTRDEQGFCLDLDYVGQCVPFIEKELKEIADECMEQYGSVPDHHEGDKKRTLRAEMEILAVLSDDMLRKVGLKNVLIAMDTMEESIYPIPTYVEHDDYGGIIKYVPADTLVGEDGTIYVDKVKELVRDFINPI